MTIYYYVDVRGRKVGSVNAYKIEQMAKRAFATKTGSCDITVFYGILHNSEWLG